MSLLALVTSGVSADEGIPQSYTPLVGRNLLSQGLCFAQVYTGIQGRTLQGLVDAYKGTLVSGVTWRGPLMDCTGAAAPVISYGSNPQTQDLALGAFSIFARVKPDSTFNTTGGIARRNDGNTVNAGWQLSCNSGGAQLNFVRATSDLTVTTTAGFPTSGWHTIGMAYPGDLTATNVKFYFDGVVQAHSTDNNGSGAQGSDATQIFVAGESNFGGAAGTFKGVIDCLYVWRRFVRQEEFQLLTASPYLPVSSMAYRAAAPFIVDANPAVASGFPALFFAI